MTNIDFANDLTQARLNALFELSEWQKLLIHFDLAPDNFAFIPVFVPDSNWAELCRNALADFLRNNEKKQLLVINLETPDELKNLASIFFDLKTKEGTGAVWISAPIPFQKDELKEWKEAWREGMARLNQYRNPFREKFEVPVLLVGAEWTKEITRNMAPDLWSVITISVRIEPPDISIGDINKIEFAATANQFEGWRGVDPDFALKEAERLRGQPHKELGLARLLFRAANGFLTRTKYRESLQTSTEAAEVIQQILSESNERNDSEIRSLFASILNTKGIVLWSQGRVSEAIAEYDKAIIIFERLVNEEQHDELARELAMAYMNKGNALPMTGKLAEAITEFDKAITILERFVNEEQHDELASELAMAYGNRSVALKNHGRLAEAIAEYDKAIIIFERLVNEEQHDELASELAIDYVNKGNALTMIGKLAEAIAEYDKAITIFERLVNEEQHDELANNLAKAYGNKANSLKISGEYSESVKFYDSADSLWKTAIDRGEDNLIPEYLKLFSHRIEVLIKLENYQRTANDFLNAFQFINLLQEPDFPEYFKQIIGGEIGRILFQISSLPTKKREEIYKHAGENGDAIRQFVNNFGEDAKSS